MTSASIYSLRILLVMYLCSLTVIVEAFLVVRTSSNIRLMKLLSAPSDSASLQEPAEMRLREIQSELKQRNVSFDDCFDRDSLTERLLEARATSQISKSEDEHPPEIEAAMPSKNDPESKEPQPQPQQPTATTESFDREATLAELRTQRVKSLREQLSKYNVRWGTMIEKEELVRALCDAMEDRFLRSQNFSRSGQVLVGEVCDANQDELMKELGWLDSDLNRGLVTPVPEHSKPTSHSPLLLDVYATWCGPCQFMVPHLKEAAKEFGSDVRVVKLDSDKYPRLASALKAGGLPTVILFDGGDVSKEVDRVEGAMTKDQLVAFVKKHF